MKRENLTCPLTSVLFATYRLGLTGGPFLYPEPSAVFKTVATLSHFSRSKSTRDLESLLARNLTDIFRPILSQASYSITLSCISLPIIL